MPRIEFNTEAEVINWADKMTSAAKYAVYTTTGHDIIFEPRTSTSPVKFGLFRAPAVDQFQRVIARYRERGYDVFACGNYEFNSDRATPGTGGNR